MLNHKLLDLFPDEAGGKNKKARVIPFLPGKRFPFTSKNSRETAEKRFPEIVKYIRCPDVICCASTFVLLVCNALEYKHLWFDYHLIIKWSLLCRTLLNLPDYIIEHKHVVEFFRPKQHDVAVQDLEKIKTITSETN